MPQLMIRLEKKGLKTFEKNYIFLFYLNPQIFSETGFEATIFLRWHMQCPIQRHMIKKCVLKIEFNPIPPLKIEFNPKPRLKIEFNPIPLLKIEFNHIPPLKV